MKKGLSLYYLILLILVALQSCVFEWSDKITGDGNVVSEIREAQAFSAIDVSGGLNVYVTFNSEPGIEVVADENLHEVIRTEIRGNTLRIRPYISIRQAAAKEIYVTVPFLNQITVSSAAKLYGQDKLETDELILEISSAGNLKLDVNAKKINFDASSSGSASIKGKTEYLNIEVSSAGDIDARELTALEAEVKASSAGSAVLYVTEKLTAHASSAGSISYYGDPEEKEISNSSAGSVKERGK